MDGGACEGSLDDAYRAIAQALEQTAGRGVVRNQCHDHATAASGLCLGVLEQCARQATTAQRLLDPHRLQVQTTTEDDTGEAGGNAAVGVTQEYGELLLLVNAGGCDRGLGDLRLKEG